MSDKKRARSFYHKIKSKKQDGTIYLGVNTVIPISVRNGDDWVSLNLSIEEAVTIKEHLDRLITAAKAR